MRLGIIGDPVDHSRSPALQRGFMAQAGRAGSYETIRVRAGDGASAIGRLRAAGYVGLNVTTPLKEEAYRACDRVDAIAGVLGAVNTIAFGARAIYGFNTDVDGALGVVGALGGERVDALVLGAGPTARATVVALARTGHRVVVWNRTAERAAALARASGVAMWDAVANARAEHAFDVAFSTLAPDPDLPREIRAALLAAGTVVDANYGPRATLGALLGRPVVDGLTMLEASARASFERWSLDDTDDALERATEPRTSERPTSNGVDAERG